MNDRSYTPFDTLLIHLDKGVRTVFGKPQPSGTPTPGAALPDSTPSEGHRRVSEGLMRVNHAGEVAAQALYHAQSIAAREGRVREKMAQAAGEENDHLLWCQDRLQELGGRTSFLDPLWYFGSFAIGLLAGLAGDRWSLGFVVETERQVVRHLDGHLNRMPPGDLKSRAILEQMKEDEAHHATVAIEAGAAELPEPVKVAMSAASKVMTTTAYWL